MLYPEMMNTVRIVYPSARFDANEVSVGIELTVYSDWCIWSEDPGMDLIGKRLMDLPVGTDLAGRMFRCVTPETLFPASPTVPDYVPWIFNKTKKYVVAAGNTSGADGYAYLQINIGNTISGWIELATVVIKSNRGDRSVWYNSGCTLKFPEGSAVFYPAPETFKQYPYSTLTIVG